MRCSDDEGELALKCVMRECGRSGIRYPAASRRHRRRDAVRDAEGRAAARVPRPCAGGLASGLAGGRRARGGGERRSHQLPQAIGLPLDHRGGHLRGPHRRASPGRRKKRTPTSQT